MIGEATKLQATDAQAGIWYAHELDEKRQLIILANMLK